MQEKVAVITEAAGVIGTAMVRRFLREGIRVPLLDRDADALDRVSTQLVVEDPGISPLLLPLVGHVERQDEVAQAFQTIDAHWGRVDIAVANAGIAPMSSFIEMDPVLWESTLAVNLAGVFGVCQAAARRRMCHGGGVLITMSSTNGLMGERGLAAYNASKAGVLLLTKTMAMELAEYGIRANALHPGLIATGLAERSGMDPAVLAHYTENVPMRRLGSPEEVANVAYFLASDEAAFVTGTGIVIDGGQTAKE